MLFHYVSVSYKANGENKYEGDVARDVRSAKMIETRHGLESNPVILSFLPFWGRKWM